jgi:hypothetical protein
MANFYQIGRIVGGGTPTVELLGDFTSIFRSAYWFDGINSVPFYSDTPVPPGPSYRLIPGTAFTIVNCSVSSLNGTYSVRPLANSSSPPSVVFSGTRTLVLVTETVPVTVGSAIGFAVEAEATDTSFYRIAPFGSPEVIIPPTLEAPVGGFLMHGRYTRGWGETYAMNMTKIAQHSAGPTAPVNPLVGQTWFDTTSNFMKAWNGSAWILVGGAGASIQIYQHHQVVPATTWTIPHNFALAPPYLAHIDAYVDRSGSYKPIIPADVTFVNANTLEVTFSNPEVGYLIART